MQLPCIPAPQHVQWCSPRVPSLEVVGPVQLCVVRSREARTREVSGYLAEQLRECTDLSVAEQWAASAPPLRNQQGQQPQPGAAASTIVLEILEGGGSTASGSSPLLPFPEPQPAEAVAHEAYSLSIEPEQAEGAAAAAAAGEGLQGSQHTLPAARCHIKATTPHGLFNGCQTLLQILLMPCLPLQPISPGQNAPQSPGQEGSPPPGGGAAWKKLQVPHVIVHDAPRFPWRGFLLDCGRHYFSVPFLKQVLNLMARYRLNRLHWHLCEDQGWRIEIKSLPRLTSVGAWRRPIGRIGDEDSDAGAADFDSGSGDQKTIRRGGRKLEGGFYTQEEVRDIVRHAASLFIEVVPEIELPGHCVAALAAYPQVSCTGDVRQVSNHWGVHEDVYCAGKEETFEFLGTVLNEVLTMFPFKFIHVGADEVPKSRWSRCPACQARMRQEGLANESQLQTWFVSRIARWLALVHNRTALAWDEVLETGGSPHVDEVAVMSWRGTLGGILATLCGKPVVMTPNTHCYLDYRQLQRPGEPGAWYATLPLRQVFEFDPVPSNEDADRAIERLGGRRPQPTPQPVQPDFVQPEATAADAAAIAASVLATGEAVGPEGGEPEVAPAPAAEVDIQEDAPEVLPNVVFPPPPEGITPVTDVIGVTPGAMERTGSDVMVLDPGAALEEANVVVREGANFSLGSNTSMPTSRAASVGAHANMAVDDIMAGGGTEQYKEAGPSRLSVGSGPGSRGDKSTSGMQSVAAGAGAGSKGVSPEPLTNNLAHLEQQQQQQREQEVQEEAEQQLMQREQMEHLLQVGAITASGGPLPPPSAPLLPTAGAVSAMNTGNMVVREVADGVVLEGGVEPLVPPAPVVPPPVPLAPGAMADGGGGLTPEERSLIKGGQANLWTEFVPDEPTAWYMMLPRLPAMAEAIWRQSAAHHTAVLPPTPAAVAAAACMGRAPPLGLAPKAGSWDSFLCRVRDAHAPQWDASSIPNCPVEMEGVF